MGGESLPTTCQINPRLDLYRAQEINKQEVTRGDWKCLYCGKRFRSEFYMDRHMHTMHSDKLDKTATTCLADLCPIFGCEQSGRLASSSSIGLSSSAAQRPLSTKKEFQTNNKCTQADVEKSMYRCEVMAKRCFGLLDSKLQSHFFNSICGKLHCEEGILRGTLREVPASEGSFVFWILRALIAGMIIVFAAVYIVFVGIKVFPDRDRAIPDRGPGAISPSVRALRATFDSLAGLLSPAKHAKKKS